MAKLLSPEQRDKILALLPPSARAKVTALSPDQQHHLIVIGLGAAGFILLWLLFSIIAGGSSLLLDMRKPPAPAQGARTAIVVPQPEFPLAPIQPAQPAAKPAIIPLKPAMMLTPTQQSQLLRLKQNVDHQYKNILSFPLHEAKMISFAQAAAKIDQVNHKWDALIAGAPSDILAVEYLSSATQESTQALQQVVGLSLSEYNEIYALSGRDRQFNEIANAYKNLVAEGIWGPVTPVIMPAAASPPKTQLRFPTAPKTDANPTAPAATGIGPAPAGLPKPPYSQQLPR